MNRTTTALLITGCAAGFLLWFQNFSNVSPDQAPNFAWTESLPITFQDPGMQRFGGTELRGMVTMDGSLYAVNGYWDDSKIGDLSMHTPQVYRLDQAGGKWQVEYELPKTLAPNGTHLFQALSTLQKLTITTDRAGTVLSTPVKILISGAFSLGDGINVFSRRPSGEWDLIPIPPQSYFPTGAQVRSFAVHQDQTTGKDIVFAGSDDVVFAGGFDMSTQNIVWKSEPDYVGPNAHKTPQSAASGRITAMIECNGKLYSANALNVIMEREDGDPATWKTVFSTPSVGKTAVNTRGFSGLTCIANPSGKGRDVMLVSLQGVPTQILKVDPNVVDASGQFQGMVDLDVTNALTQALGTDVTTAIVAYNDMTAYHAVTRCPSLLIGFSVHTPDVPNYSGTSHKYSGGGFFIRDCDGNYSVRWVDDRTVSPEPQLVAVRTIVESPFSADPAGTIYAGGFDAGDPLSDGDHNTAWLYRGIPTTTNDIQSCTVLDGQGSSLFEAPSTRAQCVSSCSNNTIAGSFVSCTWGNVDLSGMGVCSIAGHKGTVLFSAGDTQSQCRTQCQATMGSYPDGTCTWWDETQIN